MADDQSAVSAAAGWAARSAQTEAAMRPVSDQLLGWAVTQPGQVILDLAAGPGGLGHRAADIVGHAGRVLSTDLDPEMVAAARRIGAQLGLDNVEYRVLDAQDMDLVTDCVDGVVCRSGYMLMPDPAAAFRETRRVLRPGGVLAFSVFADPEANPFLAVPHRILVENGHLPVAAEGPPVFSLQDTGRIRELLTEAGFASVDIVPITMTRQMPSGEDLWSAISMLNVAVASAAARLEAPAVEALRRELLDGFARYRADDGSFAFPVSVWTVAAS